ncbi:hypothetical protein SeLEV6574_g07371 [Synchytrium endobioticum]|nr:hypothetical protein SeLEV6574_g07371 [Synchytrium endobioticum]
MNTSNGSGNKLNLSTGSRGTASNHGHGNHGLESDADVKLKTGLQLIQEAYDHRATHLTSELAQWKAVANTQRQQIHALEAELTVKARQLSDHERRNSELERAIAQQLAEKKALITAKNSIQDRYQALKRSAAQLETFRKSIVSMVEYGPVSSLNVIEMDRSFDLQSSGGPEEMISANTSSPFNDSPATSHVEGSTAANVAHNVSFLEDRTMRSFDLSTDFVDSKPIAPPTSVSKLVTTTPRTAAKHSRPSRRSSPTPGGHLPPPSILKYPSLTSNAPQSPPVSSLPPRIPTDWTNRDNGGTSHTPSKRSEKTPAKGVSTTPNDQQQLTTPAGFNKPNSTSTPNNETDDDDQPISHTTPLAATLASPSSPSAYIDAPTLYKHIRDSLLPNEFEEFASNVAAFNSSQQSADDTVRNIGRIVRDRTLFAQMRTLIYTALAESSAEKSSNIGE